MREFQKWPQLDEHYAWDRVSVGMARRVLNIKLYATSERCHVWIKVRRYLVTVPEERVDVSLKSGSFHIDIWYSSSFIIIFTLLQLSISWLLKNVLRLILLLTEHTRNLISSIILMAQKVRLDDGRDIITIFWLQADLAYKYFIISKISWNLSIKNVAYFLLRKNSYNSSQQFPKLYIMILLWVRIYWT